ncbi:MAG: DUF3883 domain-containing protein [Planctomycetes bacterium]|nr:DUF3883 domain-containing protein [Planctomycetota bacterium]
MTDSLVADPGLFDRVRWNNIYTLYRLACDLRNSPKSYVRRRFEEHATEFERTLEFMEGVGFVCQHDSRLGAAENCRVKGITPEQLLDQCRRHPSFGPALRSYFRQFRVDADGRVVRHHGGGSCTEFFGIRDLLMDLRVVLFDNSHCCYELAPDQYELFIEAHRSAGPSHPSRLTRRLEQRRSVGADVEAAVIDYERSRIAPENPARVRHVAAWDSAAGYDIESITVEQARHLPRYIEVKAVSAVTYRFYWSRTEIAMAKLLKKLYYLYLVPVAGNRVQLDQLRIVENPLERILTDGGDWAVEPEVLCCQLSPC